MVVNWCMEQWIIVRLYVYVSNLCGMRGFRTVGELRINSRLTVRERKSHKDDGRLLYADYD